MIIVVPEFGSPMYDLVWTFIAHKVAGTPPPSWMVKIAKYKIVTNRHAVLMTQFRRPMWHHLCHPRLMHHSILTEKCNQDNPWFEAGLHYMYFNDDHDKFYRCQNCSYRLRANEKVLVKMALLGMMRDL